MGGGEGSARRRPRARIDNGIPGTKHSNKAFAFINRAPAAASGRPAGGGVRRRSAAGAPHLPGRAAPPHASDAPRAAPAPTRRRRRRASGYLARLLPDPGPGPRGAAGGMEGVGRSQCPGGSGHALRCPFPGSEPPTALASGPRPCPPPPALPAVVAGAQNGRQREGFGDAGAARGCEARELLPRRVARPPPCAEPARPPPSPALAAGDSSVVTGFPLGSAWGLHRRSRKCAVPGPLPCSEEAVRGGVSGPPARPHPWSCVKCGLLPGGHREPQTPGDWGAGVSVWGEGGAAFPTFRARTVLLPLKGISAEAWLVCINFCRPPTAVLPTP